MIPIDNLLIKIVVVLAYTFVQLHYDEIFRLGAIATYMYVIRIL